jgi:hypothetical protein
MTGWPEMVNQAVTALRLDPNRLRRLGGASGATWDTGQWVLRVGQPAALDTELMAATAAAGVVPVPRVIERARTWATLTLDPAARARHASPGWRELMAGWMEAADLDEIPPAARAWACRYMLRDLSRRDSPAELEHVQEALARTLAPAVQPEAD